MGDKQNVTVLLNGEQHEGTLVNGFVHLGRRKATYGTAVSNTGKSIQETIWQELDDVMDLMMESGKPSWRSMTGHILDLGDVEWDEVVAAYQDFGKWQGIAEALCLVICLFENPHHPDIGSVKGEAVLRYKRRQEAVQLNDMEQEAPDVVREEDADSTNSVADSSDGTVS